VSETIQRLPVSLKRPLQPDSLLLQPTSVLPICVEIVRRDVLGVCVSDSAAKTRRNEHAVHVNRPCCCKK
jgi:hypothetical protein